MANITITFGTEIPHGLQKTDIIWYLDVSENEQIEMGPVTSINGGTIIVNAAAGVRPPATTDFIFYKKKPMVSTGSIKGYYAEAKFKNDSTDYAELYSVGMEVFDSSK